MSVGVPGYSIGHATRDATGCTVVVAPERTAGGVEVRGGAPATRETDLLDPTRTVVHVDAVLLTGGSVFGLAAADGVVGALVERGRGFPTVAGPVPIVPTAAVFDLGIATGPPPTPTDGAAATRAALAGDDARSGRIGAGAGTTVGKWRGTEHGAPGGFGVSPPVRVDDAWVGACAVVNAVGDVVDVDGRVVAGTAAGAEVPPFPTPRPFEEPTPREHTTLVVVMTDAHLDAVGARLVAESAHDGIARAVRPSHTRFDGDVAFALASGTAGANLDRLRVAAADVVADAVRRSVRREE